MEKRYEAKSFSHLEGLAGISDGLLRDHVKLYEGYVSNVNELTSALSAITREGKASGKNLAYAELTRRLGFEYGGMVLHEFYFGNLARNPAPLAPDSALAKAAVKSFGSVEHWLADFKAIAALRGVGWAIAFQNPADGLLSNHWVTLHQDGTPPGFRPIVVMDAWEHAFVPDYKPTERAKYIEAYFKNLDYRACEARLIK